MSVKALSEALTQYDGDFIFTATYDVVCMPMVMEFQSERFLFLKTDFFYSKTKESIRNFIKNNVFLIRIPIQFRTNSKLISLLSTKYLMKPVFFSHI